MSQAPEASLWEEIAEIVRLAARIWGSPRELFEEIVLPRAEARRLAAWIGALEAAARALLVVLAARLPPPAPGRRRAPDSVVPLHSAHEADEMSTPANGGSVPGASELDHPGANRVEAPPESPDSDRWAGVAFRLTPRTSGRGGSRGASGVRSFLGVRGLAFRLEALSRVAAAPEVYARRLARRLVAEPRLARRLLSRSKHDPGRPPPYADLVAEAERAAWSALGPAPPKTG